MENYYNLSNRKNSFGRLLYTVIGIFLFCQYSAAQLTIPAGNTFSGTSNRPLGAFYAYDRTLSVYTASQINIASGSTITGIRYYCQIASTTVDLPVFVYLKNGGSSSYSSSSYNPVTLGATLVFAGTLPAGDFQAGKWITIPFTTPFDYTGTNLQILVGTNYEASNSDGPATKAFRWSDTSQNQTQYWNSNIAPTFPSNGTVVASKPNIQILYSTPGDVGTLSLDYATDTMLEHRTKTFAVNRSGGSSGAISVDYATSDGTAIAGVDYNATSGTLTWADGDMAPKLISITTLADFIQDNGETINITLSNPVGTTFVGPSSSVVTVTDVLPPMNGTYTVGTGGNYASLTNAGGIFQAINNRVDGVSGPVTINIISDLTGETGVYGLNEIAGGHAVLIQPFGGARTITGALGTTSNLGLIRFDGTDNVTINGSLVGAEVASCRIGGDASIRQLTIINNSIGTTAAVLFTSSTTGAYNNTIKNVNLVGAGPSVGYGAMFRVFPHSVSIPSLVNNQNSRVVNCSVKRASVGIYSAGSTTSNPNTNLIVTGNDISATGADRVSKNAIFIANETNPQVTFNKVNIQNTTTDQSETVGLAIGASQAYATSVTSGGISGALVANNWITGVVSTVDLGGSTAGIAISGTAFGTPNVVRNNMISNVSGLSQFTYNVAGIWVVGAVASETKLYHNTISLYGDRGARTNQSPSYGIAISGLDPSVEMRNNIISTTQIATGGGFVKTYAFGTLSTTFANLISDNNIFYSGGAQDGGFRSGSLSNNAGTSYATLADWRAATQRDSNSIEVAPVFVAPNDLHLLAGSNPIIEATPGTPIASVTTDIDCNSRSATNPAIGAQEINVSGYSVSAAAGTGGTITPVGITSVAVGGSQSYTITANCGYLIADVLVDGISQGAITTYTFTGITASHTITATFSAVLPTITAAGPTTFCVGGSVVLTSSSVTGNVWSTGETTQSISAQAAANYWVSVNNGTCNSQQSAPITVTITAPATAPTISANGSLTFCQGGSVTLTSSATTGNLWSNGATTRAITVSASGNYSVVYNNGGCDSAPSAVTTVTVNPLPATPIISASGSTTLCTGGTVVLTSSSATGNTWSTGATTQSITVSTAGDYTVRVNNGTCSSAVSDITTVIVNAVPARPTVTVTGTTTFCQGGSVVLTSSATTGNLWSNGETTQAITVTESGIYNVTSTVNGCTSTASANRTITVNPLPATPTITAGGSTTLCTGGSVVLTSSSATGNAWSTGASTQSITVSASGNYTVTVTSGSCTSAASAATTVSVVSNPTLVITNPPAVCSPNTVDITAPGVTAGSTAGGTLTYYADAATTIPLANPASIAVSGTYYIKTTIGTCSDVKLVLVTINPAPAAPTVTAGSSTTFCEGGSVVLTSSATTGNVWSNGATTQSVTVSTAGNYSVTVTANGCSSSASADTTVAVNQIPAAPTVTAGSSTTFCEGGSVVLTSSAATGNVWSNGATTQSVTVSAAGNYSVTVTANGCSSSASADTTVAVNQIPAAPTVTAGSSTTFCEGGSVVLTSSAATGNVWSNGATTQSVTVSAAGNYSVTVTANGCSSSASADTTVAVNQIPAAPTVTAGSSTTFCEGGSVVLTSSAVTGNVWSNGATTQSVTVSTAGNYSVTVTANGCSSSASADTTVAVNQIPAAPTVTAGSSTTFCEGGSVVLTSSSATGNVWSNGATTQSVTVSTAGNYSVMVTANGCSSSASAETAVNVNPAPNVEVTQNQGIITATQTGATYQWYLCPNTLIDGATSQTYTPLEVGDYKVEITLGNCTATSDCITVTTLENETFDLNKLKIYPNPVTDILTIEYTNELIAIGVFNMLGQEILEGNVNANQTQVDLSRLPTATYLVKVTTENGTRTFKIVKK